MCLKTFPGQRWMNTDWHTSMKTETVGEPPSLLVEEPCRNLQRRADIRADQRELSETDRKRK